jgi:hypothetical protein
MRNTSKDLRKVIVGVVLLSSPAVWAELVYQNSREYSTNFVAYAFEYGDEITLAGSARTVTTFQFECFGDFASQGVANVRLRLFANDGPGRFPSPGTLLYQSEQLGISAGFNTLSVSGLSVTVPNTLTWTVVFGGLTMNGGDQAGLVLYGNPTVGTSYNDYWQKSGSQWELYRFPGGKPVADFAARVYAAPDPPVSFRGGSRLPGGFFRTMLSGPIGGRFEVQVSSDLRQWTPLTSITFPASTLDFLDSLAETFDRRFYRMVSLPPLSP